jgi:hypothetical protein
VAALLLLGIYVIQHPSEIHLADPDAYMRLVQVEQAAEGGSFHLIGRGNTPYGESLHWTRPVSWGLSWGSVPFRMAFEPQAALLAWSIVSGPLLLIVALLLADAAFRPVLSSIATARWLPLLLLCQPGFLVAFLPGRPDHHAVLLTGWIGLVGLVLAFSSHPTRSRSVAIGLLLALLNWISVESLAATVTALAALSLPLLHLREPGERLRCLAGLAWTTATLWAGTTVAVILEYRTEACLVTYVDSLSLVHVRLFGWITMAVLVALACEWGARQRPFVFRLGLAPACALAAVCGMAITDPLFFKGPYAAVDPEARALWLACVAEVEPLLAGGAAAPGRVLLWAGLPLLGLVACIWERLSDRKPTGPVTPATLWLVVFTALVFYQVRWTSYAAVIGAVFAARALHQIRTWWVERQRGPVVVIGGTLATFAICALPLFGGLLMLGSSPAGSGPASESAPTRTATMFSHDPDTFARFCRWLDAQPGPARGIMTFVDLGPEILYRTRHAVVAVPYHRDGRGLVDSQKFFQTAEGEEARSLFERRRLHWVLLAPGTKEAAFYRAGSGSLYQQLKTGNPPPWLRRVNLPAPFDRDYLLYKAVSPNGPMTGPQDRAR